MGGTITRAAATLLVGVLGACSELDPETGALRPTCEDVDSDPAVAVDFGRDIRPLIDGEVEGTRGCLGCHDASQGSMEGFNATGLDLSKLQLIRRGARDGATILVPGKPCASLIVQKLQGTAPNGARMPRGGPFWDEAKIRTLRDWIAEGAPGADE